MRIHFVNAAYGVLDYAAYPIGMLLVAPVVLHSLGVAEFGIWTVATAAASVGGIIASGFGDANIQHIASLRGSAIRSSQEDSVRNMMGLNLSLGGVLAAIGFLLAPYAAAHIVAADPSKQRDCLMSLRIASVLMLVRALESVSMSTQRAFERYGASVRISIGVRVLSLAVAGWLASMGQGASSIMTASAVLLTLGTWAQLLRLRQFMGGASLWPAFHRETVGALFSFGAFSWLQAVAGVLFGQADRLLIGVSLGAAGVASYTLCVQLAQPIFGLTASGLHFLFPYLSGRGATLSTAALKRTLLQAFLCNLLFVSLGVAVLLLFGERVLQAWVGQTVGHSPTPILPLVTAGSALLGLSVTGTYALLALGRVRTVTWISLAGGASMLALMPWLLHLDGIRGLAAARLCYGSVSLLLYLPLLRSLRRGSTTATTPTPTVTLCELQAETPP
jgi:O-antigen/teichoic acid export membrane protein